MFFYPKRLYLEVNLYKFLHPFRIVSSDNFLSEVNVDIFPIEKRRISSINYSSEWKSKLFV